VVGVEPERSQWQVTAIVCDKKDGCVIGSKEGQFKGREFTGQFRLAEKVHEQKQLSETKPGQVFKVKVTPASSAVGH